MKRINADAAVRKTRIRTIAGRTISYTFLSLLSVFTLVPFFWMISGSFKPESALFKVPIQWLPETLFLDNYIEIFTEIPFFTYYGNSLKLAIMVTLLQVLTSSMMGFSLAKLHYPGRETILMFYLSTMMVPFQVIMVPQFLLINKIGLNNTHWAIIMIQAFTPLGVFLLRQFFMGVPNEMIEAAQIDGANYIQLFVRIALPLGIPAISSLAIITFIFAMNDFLAPFIYLNSQELKTITLGLRSLTTEYVSKYAVQLAGSTCALLPILLIYSIGQNQIVKGIGFGGGGSVKE